MTSETLNALLQAWPSHNAVRICDAQGEVLAQNVIASHYSDDAEFWHHPAARHHDLGEGLRLQTRFLGVTEKEVDAVEKAPDKPVEIQALSRGITHELRNPLAAILTAISLVHDDPATSEETKLLLSVVRKESQRMNRILTEFSAYVKPRLPQPSTFDATQTVREVVRELSQHELAHVSQTHIKINDALQQTLLAHADEEHFRDVLRQVMHNAIEAMPRGGCLRLEGEEADDKVFLVISDSGGGFSSEGLQRAFQPFFSSKSQSTGLGLSIARSAVEASGGHIFIENCASGEEEKPNAASAETEKPTYFLTDNGTPTISNGYIGARVHIELPSARGNTGPPYA